ncbi:MAG: DUF4340 domain-containing protein [Verrucomicrobiae bacterium]|nr:DUF4340 domain-containing protein [Verrucomicrobiae bacterium]
MKINTTLFMLVAALAVAGGFLYLKPRVPTTEEREEKNKKIWDLKTSDVTEIGIKGADRDFLFEKKDGKWEIRKPLQVRASSNEMESILSGLEYMERRRTLAPRDLQADDRRLSLEDFGLAKPRLVASLKVKDKTVTLSVGKETRQGDGVYVQVGGGANIHLVGKDATSRLDKKLEDYREKGLFDFSVADIARFEIKGGSKLLEFSRTNSLWRVVQPLSARADTSKTEDFLRQISSLKAENFLTEDPAAGKEYGLEDPVSEITLKLAKQDATHTLLVGAKLKNDDKKVAVKVKGQNSIMSVPATFAADAAKPLNDFRDRRLPAVTEADVNEIEIRNKQVSTLLRRDNEKWKIVQPEQIGADDELVKKFLGKLGSMNIKEFATDVATDLDKFGLKPPSCSLILRGREAAGATNAAPAAVLQQLDFGRVDAAKKLAYARLADESSIYGFDINDLNNLPKGVSDLRSRTFFEIKKDHVASCVQKKGKSSVAVEISPEKKWRLAANTSGVLDEKGFEKFIECLGGFKVEKVMGTALNTTARQYGLDNPAATVVVTLSGTDGRTESVEFSVGREKTQKRCYLLWKNKLLVAEITEDQFQAISKDWVMAAKPAPARASAPAPAQKK